jgi:hypothetical protein
MSDWRLCEYYEMHPARWDRPSIATPMLEEESISFDIWQKDNKHSIFRHNKPFMAFDFETWADADKPATFAMVIVEKTATMEETITGGDFKLDKDGNRMKDPKTGKYLYVVDESKWKTKWTRCEKHIKTKNTASLTKCDDCTKESIKPKRVGKLKTKAKKGTERVRITRFWCWADEIEEYAIPLIMERNVEIAYAHNLTFDLVALLKAIRGDLSHPLEYFVQDPNERSRILFGGSKVMTATIDLAPFFEKKFGKEYSRKVFNYKTKRYEIAHDYPFEVRDSVKLLPMRLASIGEACGFPKGETPKIFTDKTHKDYGNYDAITTNMIDYNIQDCEVLFRGMQSFFLNIKELGYHSADLPLTSGTLGAQMIARANIDECKKAKRRPLFHKKEKSWKYAATVHNPEIDDICRKSMVGGRTQVFNDEEVQGRSFGIDAKSMYPSQMTNEELPYPDFRNQSVVKKPKAITDDIIAQSEGCVHVSWKRPKSDAVGFLSARNERGTLDWTMDKGTRWITLAEYRYAKSCGYDLKIVKDNEENGVCAVIMGRLDYNPFSCVKKWYNLRKQMKANNDPNEFVIKILLNAGGFGKFVERNQNSIICEEQDCYGIDDGYWRFSAVAGNDDIMYGYGLETDEEGQDLFNRADGTANIMGAYITAYARINMHEVATMIGAEHLLYCDTDSWKHTNADMICPMQGNELGQWDLEQEYDYWFSVAPKQYKYHAIEEDGKPCDKWKARIKGVSTSQAESQEEIDILAPQTYETIVGIKSSWRQGLEAGQWTTITKQVCPPKYRTKEQVIQ